MAVSAMDEIAPDTPVPTVEYETCERCKGSLYRGVSLDGKTRGPWHHHDRRMKHEPELHPIGEEELIVDLEIGYSAEAAQQDSAGYD